MNILLWGLASFLIAFLVHIFVWRIRPPGNHMKVLFEIFLGVIAIGLFILWRFGEFQSGYDYIQAFFLSFSLGMAYMVTYPALVIDSPSFVIVKIIDEAGTKGLSQERLRRLFTDVPLLKPRLVDLIRGGMVSQDGEIYRLTPKGVLLVRIFISYRKLLNASKGG